MGRDPLAPATAQPSLIAVERLGKRIGYLSGAFRLVALSRAQRFETMDAAETIARTLEADSADGRTLRVIRAPGIVVRRVAFSTIANIFFTEAREKADGRHILTVHDETQDEADAYMRRELDSHYPAYSAEWIEGVDQREGYPK